MAVREGLRASAAVLRHGEQRYGIPSAGRYAVPMTSGESPLLARRRVRIALREAREARALTQGEVAEAMEWSLSKVIRIEGGEVSISPNDLKPLLSYLGVRDRARIDELVTDAKAARVRQRRFWWKEEPFREHITGAMQRQIEFEREAVAIRSFSVYIFPGPLQTREFAEAILRHWQAGQGADDPEVLSESDIAFRLESRMRRREELFTRPDRPKISVLIDESMVWRSHGGRAVFAAQLADLRRLVDEERIILRIVPFTIEEAPLPTYGAFDIYYLKEDGDDSNAVLYRERDYTDEILEDPARSARCHKWFDELWQASYNEEKSLDLLQRRIAELRSAFQE
jgi:transcriptional regulator with XRE-family HTH domain